MKAFFQLTQRFFLLLVALLGAIGAQAQDQLELDLSRMNKFLDGVATEEDLSLRTDIAAVGIKDTRNAYFFTSNAGFESWAQVQDGGIRAAQRNVALNNIYNYAASHNYLELDETAELPADLRNYIESQVPGALSGGQSESLSPITSFCTFYDLPNMQGDSRTFVGPIHWTLKSFNNKADSAKGALLLGVITFCDKKWFGGSKIHVWSTALFSVIHFQSFVNRIESYFTN